MDEKTTVSSQCHRQSSKRSSYFETLSSVTSQLDFMREDLSSSHAFEYAPMSPLDLGSDLQVQTADLLCGAMHRQPRSLQQRGTLPGYDSLPGKETMVTNQPSNSGTKVYSDVFQFPPQPLTPREPEPVEEMTLRSRIVHSRLVWYLPRIYRAAAVHYLQGQPTGTFIVRSSSRPGELCLSMRHPGTAGGAFIEHFNITALPNGYRLDKEEEVFTTLDDLVLHHCTDRGSLPCPLDIPQALKSAHTRADLQSLAILEEEFWKSPHSRIPNMRQSSNKSARPASTAFMLTIQRTSPSEAGDLMDTRETKDRILSLYETDSKGNTNRHSWSSNTSGNSHAFNKSNYGHRRALSDANRQIMRYSNEVEQFDMSYLQRPPPPNSPPPLPPEDAQLSYFVNPTHQDCAVISRSNGRSSYKQLRTLSSEGSSVRSQSTISEDSMGRDSICSSSSLSSHSRQSNSSLPDPLARLSEHFPYQQPQVSSQDPGAALIEEPPYSIPKVTDISSHGATDRDDVGGTSVDEATDLLNFSTLELSGGYKQPVNIPSTLSEFDPLLVVAPPPEFGDDVGGEDISSQEPSEQSEQFSTAEVSENVLVSFDSDGNVHLNSVEQFIEDINIPSDGNSSVTTKSFNNAHYRHSELSGLFSVPTFGTTPLQRDIVDSELGPSSSPSHCREHQLTATKCDSEKRSTVRGVDCISSEFAISSSHSNSTFKRRSGSELSDQHRMFPMESSLVKTSSEIQHSSSGLGSPHHAISSVITDSGSQGSSSDLSGSYNGPHHENSPVKTGSGSQRSSSDLGGACNSPHHESSLLMTGSGSQHNSLDFSARYSNPLSESSLVKTDSSSQRSSADLSGRDSNPHEESSLVKTGSSSQRSSLEFSWKNNSPYRESSPGQRSSGSQRSSAELSGKHNSPYHESSVVKSGSDSQRSSVELSGLHNSPHYQSSQDKPDSGSLHSSSDLSGSHTSPYRKAGPVNSGNGSQRSSSDVSEKYQSVNWESTPIKIDSSSQHSSADFSGKYNVPHHECSPVRISSGSQRSSSELSGVHNSPYLGNSPVKSGSGSQRSSSDSSGRYNLPANENSPITAPCEIHGISSEISGKYDSPIHERVNSNRPCSNRSGGMYSFDTSTGTPFTESHEAGGVDRSSSEFSVEDKVSDSKNAPLDSNLSRMSHQTGSDFSGDFGMAESVSLPVSICEADDDDEDDEEALKIQAARMKRCVSLPSALIRGTNEGVFHGSKSAFFEGVPEDESVGEEGFEFVSHPEWNSENANSNRSPEESSGIQKSKKGKTFRHIKHMAKKSTKKVHRKIRPSWNKKLEILDPAASIQEVVKRLAADPGTQLGAMVDSFISSTVDKCETQQPDAVLKSLRQFMSGVKNYLFNDQEKEVEAQLDKYCNLTGMEVDAIFEGALHQILLEPLKDQIYLCFIKHFNQSESLKLLDRNIRSAKEKSPEELGIRDKFTPPSTPAMLSIKERFMDIQKAFSPLQKLEYLLHVVREIYSSVSNRSNDGSAAVTSMGADDFLPMLIYVLVHCDQIHIEIEVEYMWGLLDPSLLSGEGGYYLTVLSSAICVLKQFEEETECETKGFVTVFVARSSQPGDIVMKTVPVLPAMTAVEVCNVIIQKLNLDPETPHHIFLLDQGQENHLESHCCIFKIKTDYEAVSNRLCKFCIRAENMQVSWPVISSSVQASI